MSCFFPLFLFLNVTCHVRCDKSRTCIARQRTFHLYIRISPSLRLRDMVYLPLPSYAGTQSSYLEAYNKILSSHRRSPLSSASSVIILVAPNVDALCASRMLATLFKQDDIAYRIIPVCGPDEIDEQKELLRNNPDVSL